MDALPDWVDRHAWPHAPRFAKLGEHRLHYVEAGAGPAVVFVHGTPSWGWEWRHVLAGLSPEFRCIAPDHLGFGLSDHPPTAPYTLADHSARLGAFLDALALERVHLVVHDVGTAIGFGWAARNPGRVASLAVLNGFGFPLAKRAKIAWFSWLLDSAFGRWLYLERNASPRWIAPSAWGDRAKLTPEIQRHYLGPFPDPTSRAALWEVARELLRGEDWYAEGWARREALAGLPMALIWGLADTAFDSSFLDEWREAFPRAVVTGLAGVGHFPQEEAPDAVVAALRAHLRGSAAP